MKLALKILGVLLLLALAAPIGFALWVQSFVKPDYLVQRLEESCNCRAELQSSTLTLFSWPPTLRLKGIKIGPRDEHVGKPLADRQPMQHAELVIDMAYAELLSDDVMHGRITPNLLRIRDVEVWETLDPKRGSSLGRLFLPPQLLLAENATAEPPQALPVEPVPTPPLPEPGAPRTYDAVPPTPPLPGGEPPEEKGHRAQRIPLKEIRIEQVRAHIKNEEVAAQFNADITDLELAVFDIDVDPSDPLRHNSLKVTLKGRIEVRGMAQVQGRMQPVTFADVRLHGEGQVAPIDVQLGIWRPSSKLTLTLEKDSLLGGHMTVGDAAGDKMESLLKHGIDIRDVRLGGQLQEDAVIAINDDKGVMIFRQPAHFVLPDFQFTVAQGGWIDAMHDTQILPVRVTFGPLLKEQIIRGVGQTGLGESIGGVVVSMISDDQGNPFLDLQITGSLSHPEVTHSLVSKLDKLGKATGLGNLLGNPEEAKGLLNGLKGLFKKK